MVTITIVGFIMYCYNTLIVVNKGVLMMKESKTSQIVLLGLMIAAVCIGTMVVQIPMPATEGFINIGDSIIFITSILFGPLAGMIAGGIGSSLADLLSGYAHWAPFTLVIKGLEGLIVGYLMRGSFHKSIMMISTSIGAIFMVFGYYIAGAFLKSSFIISLDSMPGNLIQAVASIIIAIPVAITISKTSYIKKSILNKN